MMVEIILILGLLLHLCNTETGVIEIRSESYKRTSKESIESFDPLVLERNVPTKLNFYDFAFGQINYNRRAIRSFPEKNILQLRRNSADNTTSTNFTDKKSLQEDDLKFDEFLLSQIQTNHDTHSINGSRYKRGLVDRYEDLDESQAEGVDTENEPMEVSDYKMPKSDANKAPNFLKKLQESARRVFGDGEPGELTTKSTVTSASSTEFVVPIQFVEPSVDVLFGRAGDSSSRDANPFIDDENAYAGPNFLVILIHRATPRVDLFLQWVDNTFDPTSRDYLLSITLLGGVDIIFLFLCLAVRYIICREWTERQESRIIKIIIPIVLVTVIFVALAMAGAIKYHKSVVEFKSTVEIKFERAIRRALAVFEPLRTRVISAEKSLNTISDEVDTLDAPEFQHYFMESKTGVGDFKDLLSDFENKLRYILRDRVDTKVLSMGFGFLMFFYPFMLGVLLFLLMSGFLLRFRQQCRKATRVQRSIYMVGMGFLVISWLISFVLTPLVVAYCDLCYDPAGGIARAVKSKYRLNTQTTLFYTTCQHKKAAFDFSRNPIVKNLKLSLAACVNAASQPPLSAKTELKTYTGNAQHYIQYAVKIAAKFVVCNNTKDVFRDFEKVACELGLPGLFMHKVGTMVGAFGLAALLILICRLHRDSRKRRKKVRKPRKKRFKLRR